MLLQPDVRRRDVERKDETTMKLYRGALVMMAMAIGSTTAACKGSNSSDSSSADTAAATPPAAATDTDSADETATAAPPAPQAENPGPAPSPADVYVGGSWKQQSGKYVWLKGRWQAPPKAGLSLQQARWVEVGGKWEHHPAHWVTGGAAAHPVAPAAAHPAEHPAEEHKR
jgi:hypothetical protein